MLFLSLTLVWLIAVCGLVFLQYGLNLSFGMFLLLYGLSMAVYGAAILKYCVK